MAISDEIQQLISAGRFEYSLEKSNQYLRDAAELANESANYMLAKDAYRELAWNEVRPSARTALWFKALGAVESYKPAEYDQLASSYAELAVDIFQDEFSDMSNSRCHEILKRAKVLVDKAINKAQENEHKAIVLARKSAIIRMQAIGLTPEERLRLLSEASRCSNLAREVSRHAAIILECALVEWALSRLQKDDKKYISRLQSAEHLFNHEAVRQYELGAFATSRFYRMTYRYYDACITFPQLTESSKNRRRILREAAIYAESAIQLSNLHYPNVVIAEHLDKAMNLLEIAISSGYKSSREVIALAYIRSLKEGVSAGITSLADLCPERGELSWEQVLTMLSEAREGDLPADGFALGVNDSSALTRLGTFTNRFLKKSELAEALYRAAVRMNPQDSVAQTNLARFLIKRGNPSDIREADRVIQLAQTFADRRFSWWRPLLLELKKRDNNQNGPMHEDCNSSMDKLRSFKGAMHLRQIRSHYNKLKACEDHQFRGYELEQLIYAVSQMSFGCGRTSYRFPRSLVDKIHQVDLFIEHRREKYRCECKWQTAKVSYEDILKFADKIDAVGVSGLFFSMSGFSETAINKTKELRLQKAIILVDGEEVDMVMTGSLQFDDLLNAKRMAFDTSSETYFRINPTLSDG